MKFLVLLPIIAQAVPTAGTACLLGATVDNALFQATFLVFENVLMLRTRLAQDALLASTLHCMGVTNKQATRRGLQMLVMEYGDSSQGNSVCAASSFYDPLSQRRPNETSSVDADAIPQAPPRSQQCTPERYEQNPWVCMPGDWSGKFGELSLGLDHLMSKLNLRTDPQKLRRFLSASANSTSNAVRQYLSEEEIRVHVDQLAIPTCQLRDKYIGLFCEDRRLIGCAKFEELPQSPGRLGPGEAMQTGTRFLIRSLPPPPCPVSEPAPPVGSPPVTQEPSWTDKVSKEVGLLPEFVSSWWEEVKRKGKEAWRSSQMTP